MSALGNRACDVPGGVYLCQVNEHISCAACCGLYNVADPSFEALNEMLEWRTDAFTGVTRDIDSILAFREEIEEREPQERPFPEFHHCPFIGLVGGARSRVGCLLHPLAHGNKGIDFRGLSFYGGMACRDYFCPSHCQLPPVFREIVREAARDWYHYGLMITETRLLGAFFQEVARRLKQPVTKEDILEHEQCLEGVRGFLEVKPRWPFRLEPLGRVCNYFFKDGLYTNPPVDYQEIGEPTSTYDTMLRELVSHFDSAGELRQAENLLDGFIDKVVSTTSPHCSVRALSHAVG